MTPSGALQTKDDSFKTLVTGLTLPSYLHFDPILHNLYVCDHDKIKYYNVNFHKDYLTVDEGENLVYG